MKLLIFCKRNYLFLLCGGGGMPSMSIITCTVCPRSGAREQVVWRSQSRISRRNGVPSSSSPQPSLLCRLLRKKNTKTHTETPNLCKFCVYIIFLNINININICTWLNSVRGHASFIQALTKCEIGACQLFVDCKVHPPYYLIPECRWDVLSHQALTTHTHTHTHTHTQRERERERDER